MFVEQIYDIITKEYTRNKKQPICYYSLVTDPKSFSATVKTMFYLSFLVKDRRVSMWFDEHDIPYIYPHDRNETKYSRFHREGEEKQQQVRQVIMSIDKKQWLRIIEVFDVAEAKVKRDGYDEENISQHIVA